MFPLVPLQSSSIPLCIPSAVIKRDGSFGQVSSCCVLYYCRRRRIPSHLTSGGASQNKRSNVIGFSFGILLPISGPFPASMIRSNDGQNKVQLDVYICLSPVRHEHRSDSSGDACLIRYTCRLYRKPEYQVCCDDETLVISVQFLRPSW